MNLVPRAFENHFDIRSCENRGIVLDKNPKRENASPKGERRKKTSGKERLPVHVPPEKTGLTPEEEAYVPRTESRPLSRFFFVSIPLLLLIAFAGGGFWYYRNNILPEVLFQTADRHFRAGEFEEAVVQYRKVFRLKPERRDTLLRMGQALERQGKDSEAIFAYERHLETRPKDADTLILLGELYLRMGRHEDALGPLERASRLVPKRGEVRYLLGRVYGHLGSDERAAENYTKAIDSNVRDVELLLSASKSLMKLGRYREALRGFTRAGDFAASDDKRPLHSINAAKGMLGWPTDPAVIIKPGESLGALALGASADALFSLFGVPSKREHDGNYEVLSYGESAEKPSLVVWLDENGVAQIESRLSRYKTAEGLGIANFLDPKYKDAFVRWGDSDLQEPGFRYILKGGGLALYSSGAQRAAVVYRGELPLNDRDDSFWRRLED